MKKLIIVGLLMLAAHFGFSQVVIRSYSYTYSSSTSKDTIVAVKKQPFFTGQYLKTEDDVHPIMVSPNGKLYIERVSKRTGKPYKQYL
jgi:hypothetical protein